MTKENTNLNKSKAERKKRNIPTGRGLFLIFISAVIMFCGVKFHNYIYSGKRPSYQDSYTYHKDGRMTIREKNDIEDLKESSLLKEKKELESNRKAVESNTDKLNREYEEKLAKGERNLFCPMCGKKYSSVSAPWDFIEHMQTYYCPYCTHAIGKYVPLIRIPK
ncbi:MAG: hypothetical protein A2452_11155 [Candidatus Firestonebacteria bacterium RIFOXYC2_FULL_39_67]|nr:MAG: hypothetical protein A2452_11155 [Candidatus Firestonebacteria bacterium RIFOXYC2_FULL_39_67]